MVVFLSKLVGRRLGSSSSSLSCPDAVLTSSTLYTFNVLPMDE
jgi:hypothetical protein